MHQIKHILRESFLRVVTVKLSNFYKNLMCNIQKERKEYNISKLVLGSDFEIFIEGEKAYFLVCFKIWSKIKKEQNWEDSMKTGSVSHWNSVCEITWLVTDPGLFKQPCNHSSITWNRSWSSVNSMPSTLLKTIATSLEFPSSSFRLEHQTPTLGWPLMTNFCRLSTVPPTSLALFCSTPGLLQYFIFFLWEPFPSAVLSSEESTSTLSAVSRSVSHLFWALIPRPFHGFILLLCFRLFTYQPPYLFFCWTLTYVSSLWRISLLSILTVSHTPSPV